MNYLHAWCLNKLFCGANSSIFFVQFQYKKGQLQTCEETRGSVTEKIKLSSFSILRLRCVIENKAGPDCALTSFKKTNFFKESFRSR